jgi:hypothetical protein
MSRSPLPVHHPAPAPQGPIACTLSPNDVAGRLQEFRGSLFAHLQRLERPEPTRLSLVLGGDADPEAVTAVLAREQGCCAFLGFTVSSGEGRVVADLEVPAEAAPALDGLVVLAELGGPRAAR